VITLDSVAVVCSEMPHTISFALYILVYGSRTINSTSQYYTAGVDATVLAIGSLHVVYREYVRTLGSQSRILINRLIRAQLRLIAN
jgi:hypothetical protein